MITDLFDDEYPLTTHSGHAGPGGPWRSAGSELAPPAIRAETFSRADFDTWLDDITRWTDWAILTYRLARWFPPCWRAHGALVEEATALWLYWSAVWIPGTEPMGAVSFGYQLDAALSRIENRWNISCTVDRHQPPVTPHTTDTSYVPVLLRWWTSDNYNPGGAA